MGLHIVFIHAVHVMGLLIVFIHAVHVMGGMVAKENLLISSGFGIFKKIRSRQAVRVIEQILRN